MKLRNLIGITSLSIMLFIGCSNDKNISGDYICSKTYNDGTLDIISFFIREDSIASVKYKGKNYKANWSGNVNKIDIITTMYNKPFAVSLLRTNKFDINSEVYSIVKNGKTFEDACLKIMK